MSPETRRRAICAIPTVFVGLMLAAPSTGAFAQTALQAGQPKQAEKFTATAVNLTPGAGENIAIHVVRWSTDADRERLATTFVEKGDAGLRAAFEAAPTSGIIWTGETLGYSLRYTHRAALPDGGQRIILATDRRLGAWTRGSVWKATGPDAPDYPFTVLELRLNRRGLGEGKMSIATKVTVDQEAKTIALENYGAAPVLLKGVKREATAGGSTN